MPTSERLYRLADAPGGLGLTCNEAGVLLGGVALLRKTTSGFAPRRPEDLGDLMKSAYGADMRGARLAPGLAVAAEALNRGDLGRAMIATVLLRLPELSADGAARLIETDEVLAKFDPSEPRDERGRWTTGAGASAAVKPDRTQPPRADRPAERWPGAPSLSSAPASTRAEITSPPDSGHSWNAPVHLHGGQLTPVSGGSNFPPEDEETSEISPPVPNFNPSRVPMGQVKPGFVAGGLGYPTIHHPTLPNGQPWPVADHDLIKNLLRSQPGKIPTMILYVPRDGTGPILTGTTPDEDLLQPEGYDPVRLFGTPQITNSRGAETNHARDSIEEALRLAATNRFSMIYFNRSFSYITNGMVESLIRPDVVAVARPGLNLTYRYEPYETLSPGQKLEERQQDIPSDPSIKPLRGEHYKVSSSERGRLMVFVGGVHVRDVRPLRP